MTIDVKFNNSGYRSTGIPDPKFPDGRDLNLVSNQQKLCSRNLPYPAPGVGTYSIVCRDCGFTGLVTVAGRADDPRSISIPCKVKQP